MAHLVLTSSGHLSRTPTYSGVPASHLGAALLFNIRNLTVTWDGYCTVDYSGNETDQWTSGSSLSVFFSRLTNPTSLVEAFGNTYTGPVSIYYGSDNVGVPAFDRARIWLFYRYYYGFSFITGQAFYSDVSLFGSFTSPISFTDAGITPTSAGGYSFTYTGISNVSATIDSFN